MTTTETTARLGRGGRFGRAFAATALLGALASTAVGSSVPAQAATAPPARRDAAMASDPAGGTVVLFGGLDVAGTALGDTWTWNGTAWKQRSSVIQPPALVEPAMAYDIATKTVLLVGTFGRAFETWTWNGVARTWARQTPATSPPPRSRIHMAADAATSTVVLFGGSAVGPPHLNDTWVWDGRARTWALQTPLASPPPRADGTMSYDHATRRVLLFGGQGVTENPLGASLGDTWAWDGTARTWTQQTPATSPPPRRFAAMSDDKARKQVVLFSGDLFGPADTWTWTGAAWVRRTPAVSPPTQQQVVMAYHALTNTVVLFGQGAETWTWNGTNWKKRI